MSIIGRIDLEDVEHRLNRILDALPDVDDHSFVTDDGRKNQHHAALSRDLLKMADDLAMVQALVREQYWRMRA